MSYYPEHDLVKILVTGLKIPISRNKRNVDGSTLNPRQRAFIRGNIEGIVTGITGTRTKVVVLMGMLLNVKVSQRGTYTSISHIKGKLTGRVPFNVLSETAANIFQTEGNVVESRRISCSGL